MKTDEQNSNTIRSQELLVNPHLHVIRCSNNEALIKHGSRSRFSRVLKDAGRTNILGRVLHCFKEPTTLAKLEEQGLVRPAEVEAASELLEYLCNEQILITPQSYLPHVYLSMQFGGQAPQGVVNRRIGLVGAGYIGSRLARELARLQVKSINILDNRTVQPHDRLYFDITPGLVEPGASYAQTVQRDLEERSYTAVQLIDGAPDDQRGLAQLFEASDLVLVALEGFSPRTLHAVNEVALVAKRPWLSAYVDGGEALIGPLYVPGETCCYNEFEIQHESTIGLKDDYILFKESLLDAELDTAQLVLPPYLSMISGWVTTAVLPFLTTGRSFAVGRCVRFDFERLSVDYEEVLKLPRCPACGPQRPGYRHLYL